MLYGFHEFPDGSKPLSPLLLGPQGELYGTTSEGGVATPGPCADGCGTLFRLKAAPGRPGYVLTVLHAFAGGSDGAFPENDPLTPVGRALYGATNQGGSVCVGLPCNCGGTAFQFVR